MPGSGLTALQAVRDHGRVVAGQSVLVIGASGGVGSYAVQIARAAGAEVTGVARTAKLDAVRTLGAHHVIDYTAEDITAGGRRFDVILDIGGNRTLRHLRRALAPTGRLVIVGGEGGGRWLGGIDRPLRAIVWSPFLRQHLGMFVATETTADLDALRDLVDAGSVRPLVDRCYPLAETPTAIARLVDGHAIGTIAITI